VSSSQPSPESLVRRLRELADKRQREAARESRIVAQGLLGAAEGYRALADALERQPSLTSLQSKSLARIGKDGAKPRDAAPRNNSIDRSKDAMSRGDV
jgi:hypothetical protein